jgi:LmbE family N-acetylglucosaminyl deacetylase
MQNIPNTENLDGKLKNAVIVAAHPDDEILWFSSIITKVDKVFICYIEHESRPDWTNGRGRVLDSYPLPTVRALNLRVSEVFDCGNWKSPKLNSFGLQLRRRGCNKRRYENNYRILQDRLRELISPYDNVFTHNPWGEYGHEEHVQLFRAVENLQQDLGFTLWVDNYASNRSAQLMAKQMAAIDNHFFCMQTDKVIARTVRDLYAEHGCWTWYSDFIWRDREAFLRINPVDRRKRSVGRSFPLNYLDVGEISREATHRNKFNRMYRRIGRLKNKLMKNIIS